jgi:HK97 family phage major capsid protein
MKAYGRMRVVCRILNTSTGNLLDWPTLDDTSQEGEFLAEQSPVTQVNPTFGQVQFQSFLASSKQVKVSVQLLQDSAFDLEGVLSEAFAIRIGRAVNKKYTNGTGSSEPQGLVYAIQNDPVPNVVNAIGSNSNDGITGNTEANSVGTDDVDNLIAAVDPLYRGGSTFMMHYKTLDWFRKLKDKYGRPIWSASLASGEPDRIYGFPYEWNVDMDQIGAGKYPILFGNFSKHVIRDCGGFTLTRYNELFMGTHEVGFQAWLRTDSRRLQASAFSLLYNPLS